MMMMMMIIICWKTPNLGTRLNFWLPDNKFNNSTTKYYDISDLYWSYPGTNEYLTFLNRQLYLYDVRSTSLLCLESLYF